MKKNFYILFLFLLVTFSIFSESDASWDGTFRSDETDDKTYDPTFSQKGGMLLPGDHSFYSRTNDEWTGFSTFYLGYRFGVSRSFNIGVEGGFSAVPYVILANVLLYFRLFETPNRFFFLGLRIRAGYKYQDSDFSSDFWSGIVGDNYLTLQRNGIFVAADLTAAFRFGREKRHVFYYSLYPRLDFDFFNVENRVWVLFSPGMIGYEFRFGYNLRWSVAIESGYTFPIPWNSIPTGQWVNFPSLANIGIYYRIEHKGYQKFMGFEKRKLPEDKEEHKGDKKRKNWK